MGMKLLHTVQTLVEQKEQPFWVKTALESWSWEDIAETVKLFSGDLHIYYKALDSRGLGEEFLNQIGHWDESPNFYIVEALGGRKALNSGTMDTDLVIKYVVDNIIENEITDLNKSQSDGKTYLTLDMYDKSLFFEEGNFGSDTSCEQIAELIFQDKLWESWLDFRRPWTADLNELVDNLTLENYRLLLTEIMHNNKTLTCFREEFEWWVEEDNIGDDTFYVDPSRMNSFLNDDDRYNFVVLLECADGLEDYVEELKGSYNLAYNEELHSQYYNEYHKALEELLGKPVGTDKTYDYRGKGKIELEADVYDVTDLVNHTLISVASDDVEMRHSNFGEIYRSEGEGLCPGDFDEVYDDEKLWARYNELIYEST